MDAAALTRIGDLEPLRFDPNVSGPRGRGACGKTRGSENQARTVLGLESWKTHNHHQGQTELYIYKRKDKVWEGRKYMKLRTGYFLGGSGGPGSFTSHAIFSCIICFFKKSYMV